MTSSVARMRRVVPRAVAAALAVACPAGAQTPTMPSTLRYGSGLIDIPVSSVLPHLATTTTWSGFFTTLDRRLEVDEAGEPVAFGDPVDAFHWDASAAIGLFDRAEAGIAIHSLGGEERGGDVWGLFGRLRLWEPVDQGLGLAVGARWLTSPDFGDGVEYVPGRLGFADRRLRRSYTGGTNFSAYGVATAYLRGFDAGGRLPQNDMSFTLGYGGGMFRQGGNVDFYAPGHANGWFYGAALHVGMREGSLLTVMAEHNGFDVNVGAQYDWGGVRLGVQWLASNHAAPPGGHASEYAEPKLGFLASVAICPGRRGFRCTPRTMRRVEPDTIVVPAPPPDTVIVEARPSAPPGSQTVEVCLSTGQPVQVMVTPEADTLVGATLLPIDELRPTFDFAGNYAGGAFWFESGEPIVFEDATYGRSGEPFPIDCRQVLRVGVHQGVPVFADRSADRPLVVLFVPVRPGLWQRYERGVR